MHSVLKHMYLLQHLDLTVNDDVKKRISRSQWCAEALLKEPGKSVTNTNARTSYVSNIKLP